jgi:hypothetical protein
MRNYVVFVHGIGEQKPGTYTAFGERLRKAFDREVARTGVSRPGTNTFEWEEAYWADIVQPDEQVLKKQIGAGSKLRHFFIGSLGDVIAYSRLPKPPDRYEDIQKRFTEAVTRITTKARGSAPNGPVSLTIIAHSLGSVIASDGIYDLTRTPGKLPPNVTVDRLFTMGSPIALFGLRYGLGNFTKPIRPKLWVNFLYAQDLIAYRLKTLNPAYDSAVKDDVFLSPGGGSSLLGGLVQKLAAAMPLAGAASHSWYFTDSRVINRIAQEMARP